MAWDVEHTDEFAAWYLGLPDDQQEDVTAVVMLLIEHGPIFRSHIRPESRDRSIRRCAS